MYARQVFFSGVAAPCIVLCKFALLEVIAELRDRNRARAHPHFVRIDLRQENGDSRTGSGFAWIALNPPKHSLPLDPRPMQIFLGPPKLPGTRPFFRLIIARLPRCIGNPPAPRFGAEESYGGEQNNSAVARLLIESLG